MFAAEKYVCTEFDVNTKKLMQNTIVLTPKGDGKLEEGKPFGYYLESFTGASNTSTWSVEGAVKTEDVMFNFVSKDLNTTVRLYMDELDQTVLSVKGKKYASYICR